MTIQTFQLHTNRIFINFIKKVFDFTIYMCYEMKVLKLTEKQKKMKIKTRQASNINKNS